MDADNLHLTIDFVSSSGVVLSVEQKSALQSSLLILKSQQKFQRLQFWGKILGIRNDYLKTGKHYIGRKALLHYWTFSIMVALGIVDKFHF